MAFAAQQQSGSLVGSGWAVGITLFSVAFCFAICAVIWLLYAKHKRNGKLKAFGVLRNRDLIHKISSRSKRSIDEDEDEEKRIVDGNIPKYHHGADPDQEIIDELNLYLGKSKSKSGANELKSKSVTFPITPEQNLINVPPPVTPLDNLNTVNKLGSPSVIEHSIGNISHSTKSYQGDGEVKFNVNWGIDSKETKNPDEMLAEFNHNRLNWMMHLRAQKKATDAYNRRQSENIMINPTPLEQPILPPIAPSPLAAQVPQLRLSQIKDKHKNKDNDNAKSPSSVNPWHMIHTSYGQINAEVGSGPDSTISPSEIEMGLNSVRNRSNAQASVQQQGRTHAQSAYTVGHIHPNHSALSIQRMGMQARHQSNAHSMANSLHLQNLFNINMPQAQNMNNNMSMEMQARLSQFLPPPAYNGNSPQIGPIQSRASQLSVSPLQGRARADGVYARRLCYHHHHIVQIHLHRLLNYDHKSKDKNRLKLHYMWK